MNRNILIAVATILVLIISSVSLYTLTTNESINCDKRYDKVIEGDAKASEVPEKCRPLPEEVEKKLLVKALSDS